MFSPYTAYAAKKELLEEISRLRGDVETGYYTSTEVDTLIDGVIAGSVDLSTYYTKSEVDQLFLDYDPGTGTVDLTDYYTKGEVDQLFTDFDPGTGGIDYETKQQLLMQSVALSQNHASVVNNISRGVANLVDENGWFDMSVFDDADETTIKNILVNGNTEIWVSTNKGLTGVKAYGYEGPGFNGPGYIYGRVDRRLVMQGFGGDFGLKQYLGYDDSTIYPSQLGGYSAVYGGDFEVTIAIIINGQPVNLYKDALAVSSVNTNTGAGKTIFKNGAYSGQHFIGLTMGDHMSYLMEYEGEPVYDNQSPQDIAKNNGLYSTYSDQVVNPGVFTYNVPTPITTSESFTTMFGDFKQDMTILLVKTIENKTPEFDIEINLGSTKDDMSGNVAIATGHYELI